MLEDDGLYSAHKRQPRNKQNVRFYREKKVKGRAILISHEITGFSSNIYLYENHKLERIKIPIINRMSLDQY